MSGDLGPVVLAVDEAIPLMIHVSFDDPAGASEVWVEYRFETADWLIAPVYAAGAATILGIPADTEVDVRVAALVGEVVQYSGIGAIRTAELPAILLKPSVSVFDPARASTAKYALISVAHGAGTWFGPYFLEIFDRSGRIVWYLRVPDGLFSLNPTVSLDGTHLWFEAENIFGAATGEPTVTRRTLDGRWVKALPVPHLGQAITEGPDDSFYYEIRETDRHGLRQLHADGSSTLVWDCEATLVPLGLLPTDCLLNTNNWSAEKNSLMASQFETSTVFEIDLDSGEPIRQFGQIEAGDPYAFDPPESMFAYQHFTHWTSRGTLLVSTHAPCLGQPDCDENRGAEGVQLSSEYEVNDATKTLTRVSVLRSTDLWATQAGETYDLPNGNRVVGYGQDGAVREYTADGDVVWQAEWERTDDFGFRSVGHLTLIEDLYTVNQGR